MTKQWQAYASLADTSKTPDGNDYYRHIYESPNLVRMCGVHSSKISDITLTEDADGEYMGWIATGKTRPSIIILGRLFNIQFPYGYEAEEAKGKGKAIRLSITNNGPYQKEDKE